MPLAYSYLRFSSPQQASGDSIRRQVEKTSEWCKRNNVTLDTSMKLRDEGVSAFKGKHRENPDTHALAAFVNAVKAGRVPTGSYLVVESLDRLSREKIRPALALLLNLIEAGVKVVQLIPVETIYDEDVEPMQLMLAVMELNRGHSESKVKSERISAAWARKQKESIAESSIRLASRDCSERGTQSLMTHPPLGGGNGCLACDLLPSRSYVSVASSWRRWRKRCRRHQPPKNRLHPIRNRQNRKRYRIPQAGDTSAHPLESMFRWKSLLSGAAPC